MSVGHDTGSRHLAAPGARRRHGCIAPSGARTDHAPMGATHGMLAGRAGAGSPRVDAEAAGGGLVDAFRERTRSLHAEAERAGIIREILRGRATRRSYACLLRNLLPAYQQMERGLERHRDSPGVGALAQPVVYRARAIERDLGALCGRNWAERLPLLEAGERYARRVAEAGEGSGARLTAHAYTRYLGDLSGGRILRRVLARSLELEPASLRFYDFQGVADADAFKRAYRDMLDRAVLAMDEVGVVVEEAAVAFRLNIDVSEAVHRDALARRALGRLAGYSRRAAALKS